MLDKIIVNAATDKDRVAWNDYARKNNRTSCFNRYEWKAVISNTKRVEQKFLLARRNGKICGVLPAYIMNVSWNKHELYSIKNGLIAEDAAVMNSLVNHLYENLKTKNNVKINISSPCQFNLPNFQSKEKVTLLMSLEEDIEKMWLSLRSKTRNVIRKSQKMNLVLKKGNEYLNDFYKIYSDRMARKLIPFCSYRFFKRILEIFPQDSEIYIAKKNGKAIAGIFVFYSENTATYAYSAFLSGTEKYSPIHFLMWELIKDCCEKKISTIDMGESTPGSGVYNFKVWMGAKPTEIYSYRFLHEGLGVIPTVVILRKIKALVHSFLFRASSFIVSNVPINVRKMLLIRKKMKGSLT